MPSHSRAQQRFMGMVHAFQNGDEPGASAQVKHAAHSMSPRSVTDFASTSHAGLPEKSKKEEIAEILQSISEYNEMGKAIKRTSSMREIGVKLSRMIELAEKAVMSEADDWFDAKTLQRNIKELKSYAEGFSKCGEEADILEQRMTALYDDIGRILERYFEIPESQQPEVEIADGLPKTTLPSDPGAGEIAVKESGKKFKKNARTNMKEDGDSASFAPSPNDSLSVGTTGHAEVPSQNMEKTSSKVDPLTIRAIAVVYEFLKKNRPELAEKFKNLPAKRMAQIVWKMVR